MRVVDRASSSLSMRSPRRTTSPSCLRTPTSSRPTSTSAGATPCASGRRPGRLKTVEVSYDPAAWEEAVRGTRDDPASRCPRCYSLRLRQAAAEGARLGCDALATTLSVSPYQDLDAIDEAGRRASAEHGLVWLFEDYRPRYPEATRRAREEGMYRQNYCGCLPSKTEAEEQRARRRAERARR
jgi:epoxyqueuosine reductase